MPPFTTVVFSVSSDILMGSDRNQGPGADILSEDGSQLLAHAAPIFRSAKPGPIIKTVDMLVDPAATEDPAYWYASAKATYRNADPAPQTLLLRVQSAAARTEVMSYQGVARLSLLEFIATSPAATAW